MRITRDEMLMEVAHVVARRGTCSRLQVGAVFAQDGRIVATGYNGAPRGMPHCTHESYFVSNDNLSGPKWFQETVGIGVAGHWYYWDGQTVSNMEGCTVSEHAERNAIYYAAGQGINLGNSDLYVTHQPCYDCARGLISIGIRSVTFQTPYRKVAGLRLLEQQGIKVIDLSKPERV